MINHKTCLDPTCEARQSDCPWPDSEPEKLEREMHKRLSAFLETHCLMGPGLYCRDCILEAVCSKTAKPIWKESERPVVVVWTPKV